MDADGIGQLPTDSFGESREIVADMLRRGFANFTTNGVLLTDEVLDFLESLHLSQPATFQISLDGNREKHDNTRVRLNRKPTSIVDTCYKDMSENDKNEYLMKRLQQLMARETDRRKNRQLI